MTGTNDIMTSVVTEPCDVCLAVDSLEPWLEVSVGGLYDRWVYRCRSCGFRQVRPRLTPEEIARLYHADYFDTTSSVGYGDYAREAQRRRRDAFFVARRSGPGRGRRALEVGCALGFMLAGLRDEGYDVTGVDASSFAAYYARSRFGLSVTCGTLEEAGFPDASFDLVVQKDLLEHVGDPRAHLEETCRLMRPRAELWIVTPNGEANLRPLLDVSAKATDAGLPLLDQGHLSFFAEAHLRALFAACGLEVLGARAIGIRRGLRALGRLPGQRRFARCAPRAGEISSLATPAPATPDEDADYDRLGTAIDRDVARHHRWIRGWRPYYYVHRLSKWADSLPAATGLGYDFEFRLRKTGTDAS